MEADRKLAERARAGDERAFEELVERHREPLLRYVARRFNPELAEDAVQEALLSAHRAILGGTVPADMRAWLSTIAWRRALDLARREKDSLPLDAGVAGNPAQQDPEARAIQANELVRVVAAFTELPDRQRKALALSALEGRSLEEIGDALDVAPDTAKSLVARSRRTLSHRLAAADRDCSDVRLEMETATTRGVRLSGEVTLHMQGCRACARAHRAMRRRRRVAALLPLGLLIRTLGMRDRVRDLVAFNPAWEAQVGAAKMCTAACLSIGATATVAAPTVSVVTPIIAQHATPTPKAATLAHHKRKHQQPKPKPTATATWTPTWTPTATPPPAKVQTASSTGAQKKKPAKRPGSSHFPENALVAGGSGGGEGGGESAEPNLRRVEKAPTATPTATATPAPTVAPTEAPVETPVPTPPAG